MYNSQFDGNAAFSGGGFMPSQATQSADPSISPAKSRDLQALVPLTVKQLNEALIISGDRPNIVVDGVDISTVTLVGLVCNKVERVTEVGFVLDDGTGRIDVHRWVDQAFDTKETESIVEGMYVRIHGNLKGFQGKKQLVAFSVRPLTDFNELTYHFLECIYVHLCNTKAASLPSEAQVTSSANGTPFRGYQGTQQNQFAGQCGDLQGVDKIVVDYLQLPVNLAKERGVHVKEIVQRYNIPYETIMASIKALEVEGLVYSTVDDEHYKSTGNA